MTEHRSRIAWAAMPERRAPARARRIALFILYGAVTLNMLLTALVFSYVVVLKSSRDTETARIHEQLVTNNCALLDQLPAGPVLDRLRDTYHCGPGLPAEPTP